MYDVTNTDTFARAKTWVKELQRQASPNIVIALAGNKADLSSKRMVEHDEANQYAEVHIHEQIVFETSALSESQSGIVFRLLFEINHWRFTCGFTLG